MFEFLSLPVVLAAGQFVAGFFLKRWPAFPNHVIPVATYVLGLIGFTVAPKEANAAGILDSAIGGGSIFAVALIQNLAVTGIHSTWKNTVMPALMATARGLFGRWLKIGGKQ